VRGRHAAGDLVGALAARGIPVKAAELYDQVPQPLSPDARALIAAGAAAVVPLFSPRTARIFARETADLDLSAVTVVGLSAAVVAPVEAGRRIVTRSPGRVSLSRPPRAPRSSRRGPRGSGFQGPKPRRHTPSTSTISRIDAFLA